MTYKYNSWKHSKRISFNDKYPDQPWEVALFSAYSGRKLKVYARCITLKEAKIRSSVIKDEAKC